MKKKRLSVFSLLIALTLTLGACDDLEDLFPSGSDSDESTELTEDEDPNTGVNPNEDEDENEEENNDDNDDEEKGNEPVITYSLSITNKADLLSLAYDEDNPSATDYTLAVSLLTYTDGELTTTSQLSSSDVTVTSSNEEVATVEGLTLSLGSTSGSSEIVAVWNSDTSVTDSFTLSYTYTAHVEKIDYEYNLSITNKTELLGTDSVWLIDSGVHTFELGLTKTTIVDGVEGDSEQVTNFTAILSQTDSDGNEASIVSIDGLSVTPAALGSVRITATFIDGDYSASDYIEVMINESYYEGDYSLTINNVTDFTGTAEEDVWRVGTGISLDVTLSYQYYAYSTGLAEGEAITLTGTYDNLSVLVYNSSGDCVTGEDLTNDIYYYSGEDGLLALVPQEASANNTYVVVVYWTGHTEAYETFTVTIGEKLGNSYSLEITSNEIPSPWYYEDNDSYTVSFKITETNKETGVTSEVTLSDIASEITIRSTNEEVATATLDSDYSIKITAVGAGSASIYIIWSTHTEAIGHVELNIAQHSYELLINTPDGGLGTQETPWRIEEGTRSISLSATMDGAEANPTYVEVKSSDESVVTVTDSYNSYTLTPVAKGSTTIVASWYKESGDEAPLATAVVPVYISDEIVAVSVSLTQTSISFNEPNETETITASVLGANETTATNQNVMWSVSGTGVSISVSQDTYMLGSTEVTVSATAYSSSATITATSEDGGYTASCDVTVEDQPAVAAKLVTETATSTIVSSPDDRGVYVLGNEGGTQFIGSDLGITSEYNSAVAVRTILADTGSYYLAIGEKYLSSSGTLVDAIDSATAFTISSGAVSSLYLGESGLTSTGGTTIYILDETYTETVSSTTGGTYYLAADVNGTIKYASGFTGSSSYRMYTSSDINDAIEFTITNVGGDEYTMTYSNNGTLTYLYLDESTSGSGSVSGYIKTSTSMKTIYYDDTNNVWGSTEDPSSDRFIGYNSAAGDGQFGNYAHGNISSYPNATLYEADKVDAIGISVVPDSYSLEQQEHTNLTLTTYPSAAADLTFDVLELTQSGSGSVTTSDGVLYTGNAGEVHVTFTYKNNSSINDSFDFEVIEDTSDVDKHEYSYTFASGNGISTSGGTVTLGGLSWTSSSAVYIGGEYSSSSRGLQIGSGNSTQTEPWTLSTTFSEEITLTSITLTLTVASGGSATYSIDLSENSIASKVSFSTTKTDYTHDELSVTGTVLTITLQASSKAMYIASISFTYTTPKAS